MPPPRPGSAAPHVPPHEAALRAERVAAMLARWEAEEVTDEPEWDIEQLERLAIRGRDSK